MVILLDETDLLTCCPKHLWGGPQKCLSCGILTDYEVAMLHGWPILINHEMVLLTARRWSHSNQLCHYAWLSLYQLWSVLLGAVFQIKPVLPSETDKNAFGQANDRLSPFCRKGLFPATGEFFIFQIGPLLREIWPLLWSNVRIMFFRLFHAM